MHCAQSQSAAGTPLSYASAKPSHRGQPPCQSWTPMDPPKPMVPTTPWMSCVPLPNPVSPPPTSSYPSSYGYGGINQCPAPPFIYPYAPSLPPVPLPTSNSSPHSSYSTSRYTSSTRSSSHTSSSHSIPLHPILRRNNITFPVSSCLSNYLQACISVRQDLQQYNISEPAFRPPQSFIQIYFNTDNTIPPLTVQISGSVSIELILQSLYNRLQSPLTREQLLTLENGIQAIAMSSFKKRYQAARGVPIQMNHLDLLGFGTAQVDFIGLTPGDADNKWLAHFASK